MKPIIANNKTDVLEKSSVNVTDEREQNTKHKAQQYEILE